jgi:hypothetical protein
MRTLRGRGEKRSEAHDELNFQDDWIRYGYEVSFREQYKQSKLVNPLLPTSKNSPSKSTHNTAIVSKRDSSPHDKA